MKLKTKKSKSRKSNKKDNLPISIKKFRDCNGNIYIMPENNGNIIFNAVPKKDVSKDYSKKLETVLKILFESFSNVFFKLLINQLLIPTLLSLDYFLN